MYDPYILTPNLLSTLRNSAVVIIETIEAIEASLLRAARCRLSELTGGCFREEDGVGCGFLLGAGWEGLC